jgi:hypothetical protein
MIHITLPDGNIKAFENPNDSEFSTVAFFMITGFLSAHDMLSDIWNFRGYRRC